MDITDMIISYLDGELPSYKRRELGEYMIDNPEIMELFGGLNRIKQQLPSGQSSLRNFLEFKLKYVHQNLFSSTSTPTS